MLEEGVGIAAAEVVEQPGLGVAEQLTMAGLLIAAAFRAEVQLDGKLLVLNWLLFHLIEILKPLLVPIFFHVPVLLPFEEGNIFLKGDHGRDRLHGHCPLHDHLGPRLVQAIIDLRVSLRWPVLRLRFRPWLVDQLHLSHGLEVVRHPDPLLATRRLEDALAAMADLLVALELLPQQLQEAADILEFSSLNLGGEGAIQEAGDVSASLCPLAWIGAGIGGVYGDGQGLDVLNHAIEAFDAGEFGFRER